MSRTPKIFRQGAGTARIGVPRRPVGGQLDQIGEGGPVDRWFCRRSPACRRGCNVARRRARVSAIRSAYHARYTRRNP